MLHVVLDEPGNRRHMAVPRPLGFLRMAVDASVGKHVRYRRGNVRTRQQRRAGSVRGFMREKMHKHRCKNPHQKKAGNGKSRIRATPQAGAPREDCDVYDCLAHALQDLQGGRCIPGL